MITLRSSESLKEMLLTEKDHAPLKVLYTEAAQNNRKKIVYQRGGEIVVADVGSVFTALTELDRIIHGGK